MGFGLAVNTQEGNRLFGIEFQYYDKSYELSQRQVSSHYWNHGEFSRVTRKFLSGTVKYGYLGTRFHLRRILKIEERNEILFGAFFQIDALVFERESNHRDSTTQTYNGVGYDYVLEEKYYYSNTTYYPVSYEAFDFVHIKKAYLTAGVNMGHRFHFKNFFTDIKATIGLNLGLPRFQFSQYGADYETWEDNDVEHVKGFYQFDLKLGYSF
jgi:hypothetical protein